MGQGMKKDWWKTFFDEHYLLFWGAKGIFAHTKKEVNFLIKNLPIKKADKILDLCCGHGRHSLELARRGYDITGLDYSHYELALAGNEARRLGLKVDFRQGDARNFKFPKKFDVIINLFTAFGYGTKADDRKIIESVSKNLKPGSGRFLIDLFNLSWLWRHYRAKQKQTLGKGRFAISERHFDYVNNLNYEKRTIFIGDRKRVYPMALRLYSLSELHELLASKGLRVVKYWGSYDGVPYSFDTKRMIVLAKKV